MSAGDVSQTVGKIEKYNIEHKLNELILTKMNEKLSALSKEILDEYFDRIENNKLN